MNRGSLVANGLTFHYLEAGTGPLVLCLHGFPDHADTFQFQLSGLAAAGFHVVAPYMRGYAPTDIPPAGPFQTAVLAQDAIALINALSPDAPAILVGHDWGALAAYGAALLAPDRIRLLVTIAVPYGPQVMQAVMTDYDQTRRSWYMFLFQQPTAEMMVSHDDFAFLERLWQDWSPTWEIPASTIAAVKATFRQPGVLQAAINYYRHAFNPALHVPELADLQAKIMTEAIAVPTLNFHGEQDGCIGQSAMVGMAPFFPAGLAQVLVPNAGHFVHQEQPDLVNQEILARLS